MIRKILLIILAVLVLIQFVRPSRNQNTEIITADDISRTITIPDSVHQILIKKCYDCHSNHTNYPWYSNIQPVAWWLAHHIKEGKAELNFSEFKNYPEKRAHHKLEEVGEVIDDGSMPLRPYTLAHANTEISDGDKEAIFAWLRSLNVEIKTHH